MRIGALDLATASGWAVDAEGGGHPRLGTFRLPDVARGHAFLAFEKFLYEFLHDNHVERVAVEKPMFVPAPGRFVYEETSLKLIGLVALTESVTAALGLPPVELVGVTTIRKYFCGHGRAKKPDVMARCRQLGWAFANDNESDAAALWSYAKATRDRTFRIDTGPRLAQTA